MNFSILYTSAFKTLLLFFDKISEFLNLSGSVPDGIAIGIRHTPERVRRVCFVVLLKCLGRHLINVRENIDNNATVGIFEF